MAKELPYFKFEPNQWQNGNIQMCSEITQLYFINMCCVYWSKLGNLNDRFALVKCFNNNKDLFDELVENKIIHISTNGDITISFLDDQLSEFKIKSKTSAESGRKGGQNNGVRPEIERKIGNQLYLLECWNKEERFYKLGITSSSISRRYSGKIQYQYKVVFQIFTDDCAKAENEICELLKNCEYKPLLNFAGQKECFLHSENQLIETTINSYFNFAKATLARNDAIREDKKIEDKRIKNISSDLKIDWEKLINQFNEITSKNAKVINQQVKNKILARLKEGYTKQDLLNAIQNCFNDPYHKETNHKYLTLEFISRTDKMEKYSTMKSK